MQWKEIPGYEGVYEVSDCGDVRRLRDSDAFKAGTLLKPYLCENGYLRLCLRKDGKGRSYGVHRLVMMGFVGVSDDLDVNHLDGVKTRNYLDNLEYCTRRENIDHAYTVLKRGFGEPHGRARLPMEDVLVIYRAVQDSNAVEWLAEVFDVKPATITNIAKRKRWKAILDASIPA